MRLTWSTFLLIALASTADALPAERRQLLSGLGDLLSNNQGESSASSSPAASSAKASSASKAPASSVSSAARSVASSTRSSVSAVAASSAASRSSSKSSSIRSTSPPKAASSAKATPSRSASASPISVSSPNLSSLSSSAHSAISSASSAKAASSSSSSSASSNGNARVANAPITNGCHSAPGDAPYTMSCGDLESVITFPNGFHNRPGGIVFLVHGTGSTGEETWGPGPYNTILPNKGPGYDIAWFTSPTRSLGDAQITAEYIAHNIKVLASKSATKKVFIIGHSQGNINIQWALKYWPSTRSSVSGWSSLAGDFHGTAEGPLLCTAQALLQGGCEPSVLQQSVGSNYLKAQNNGAGGSALVPTTSIYTIFDDIIQPEIINPTSDLPGATVLRMQDLDLCGPGYVIDHFLMTVAAGPFHLTLNALENKGVADRSSFNLGMCTYLTADNVIPNPLATIAGTIRQAALDAIAVVAYEDKIFEEPKLRPYVCQKGDSTYC